MVYEIFDVELEIRRGEKKDLPEKVIKLLTIYVNFSW